MSAPVIIHALLLQALIAVESHGNDKAVGDFVNGVPTAFGCLQISAKVVIDVNRITGSHFATHDVFDRPTAVKICLVYLNYYGGQLGRAPTTEDFARLWNGGPQGPFKGSTDTYWFKVKAQLDRMAGLWDRDYTHFTPARLRVGSTKQRSRATGPLVAHRCGSLPRATSGDRCRPTELPNTNRVSRRGKSSSLPG